MSDLLIPLAAICGTLIGWAANNGLSRVEACRAHARGLFEGRSEREWEVNSLQLRIRRLEADVRRYGNGRTAG